MSEFKSEDTYPSTPTLAGLKRNAIWCFVGGLVLAALRLPPARILPVAVAAGIVIVAVGMGWLLANNPINKKIGIFMIVTGVAQGLSGIPFGFLRGVMGTLLSIVTMWLLVTGVKNLIMYFVTQNKRYR